MPHGNFNCGVLDPANHMGYFGTSQGNLVKVDLAAGNAPLRFYLDNESQRERA